MPDNVLLLIGIGIISFFVGLSGAMMPGPLLAVTISESSRRGAVAGPLLALGHGILEFALILVVALGLANVLRGPAAMAVISIAGSAVLCWMGLAMVRSAPKATLGAAPAKARMLNPITAGIIVSLSNPYWTLWWATVGLAFLFKWPEAGRLGIVAFAVGHVLSDLAWYSFVSAGVARGRKLMPLKLYRFVLGLCGVALVGFAAWFAWHGGVQAGTVLQ